MKDSNFKINVDSYIKADVNKSIGEDYILTGMNPVPYIIIADGCSSSKQVDTGARILAHTASVNLQYIINQFNKCYTYTSNYIMSIGYSIIQMAWRIANGLSLDSTALDSTLLIAWVQDDYIHYVIYGDGNVILQYTNDMFNIFNLNYKDNMGYSTPFYLSYFLNKDRELAWLNSCVNQINTHYVINQSEEPELNTSISSNILYSKKYFYNKICLKTEYFPSIKKFIITSDGIEQMLHKDYRDKLNLVEVAKELIKVKTFKGCFMQRRCNSAFDTWRKLGYNNEDDVSVGAFNIRGN